MMNTYSCFTLIHRDADYQVPEGPAPPSKLQIVDTASTITATGPSWTFNTHTPHDRRFDSSVGAGNNLRPLRHTATMWQTPLTESRLPAKHLGPHFTLQWRCSSFDVVEGPHTKGIGHLRAMCQRILMMMTTMMKMMMMMMITATTLQKNWTYSLVPGSKKNNEILSHKFL